MKSTTARWCTILVALMATSLGIQAKTVALFFDSAYVQTNAAISDEAYNMKLSLEDLGFTVNTFTGITSNDFSTALSGVDVLVVPELELGDLSAALTVDAIGVISNFVAAGNTLVLNAAGYYTGVNFLNSVFGYTVSSGGISDPYTATASLSGTVFDGGPPSLPYNNGIYDWPKASLPVGALSLYEGMSGTNVYSAVTLIPEGSGQVVLLAWDWYNAAPNGSQDNGWNEVLGRAVQASAGLNADVYVDLNNATPVPPYASWDTAATNIQEGVDQAADGATVWVADGTYALTSEIVVSNSITVQSANGPGATIVDGGGAVRGFNLGSSACTVSGFTITNGYDLLSGGGVYCDYSDIPVVSNCVISGNISDYEGGGMHFGTANDCTFADNDADYGGGMWDGIANNCIFINNFGSGYGGGQAYGTANNCLVVGNTSGGDGAGLDSCTAINCTIVSNVCAGSGGGVYSSTVRNSIVTGNTPDEFVSGGTQEYTCSPALVDGVDGNITSAPLFVNPGAGDYRLTAGSPGIDAGNNGFVVGDTDLAGDQRIMNLVVDMGAYELRPLDHFVSHSGSHQYPFETWERAATNIQDAVDASMDGHRVHVTNGTYLLTAQIVVSSEILIQSVNGPYETIVDGGGAVRGFFINSSGASTVISGFTVTNCSANFSGGGIRARPATLATNCVITGCSAPNEYGGGMYAGTADNCIFSYNEAQYGGGMFGGTADNCIFAYNSSIYQGGGKNGGVANTCIFMNNDSISSYGGGMFDCTANNCLVVGNTSDIDGAGLDSCNANNCTVVSNVSGAGGGGIFGGAIRNSIVLDNSPVEFDPDNTGLSQYTCSPALTHGVNGNITNLPAFIDPGAGNYRLKYGSPCINAGTNGYVVGSVDLDWADRIVDTTVDMGAYEYDVATYDSDGDTLIDDDELNMYCSDPLLVNTDGDAFEDDYEVANGFAPNIFTDIPDYLADNAESYGYYTESEVLNLGVGDIGGMVTTNGTIDLWVQLWQSGDLITWTNAGPPVMWSEPVDSAVKLYRVGVEN